MLLNITRPPMVLIKQANDGNEHQDPNQHVVLKDAHLIEAVEQELIQQITNAPGKRPAQGDIETLAFTQKGRPAQHHRCDQPADPPGEKSDKKTINRGTPHALADQARNIKGNKSANSIQTIDPRV